MFKDTQDACCSGKKNNEKREEVSTQQPRGGETMWNKEGERGGSFADAFVVVVVIGGGSAKERVGVVVVVFGFGIFAFGQDAEFFDAPHDLVFEQELAVVV